MKRTRLRRRSAKRREREESARFARQRVLTQAGGLCQIRVTLADAVRAYPREVTDVERAEIVTLIEALRDCTTYAQGCHERRKRSSGGSLENPANLVPACSPCNTGFVEHEPLLAHRLGLTVRPGDPEWDELAR